jgi:stage V sporulation protein B
LRGYFISSRRVGNPAVGQVLEQLVKMAIILLLIGKAIPLGIEMACLVVVLGMTAGEIVCFLYAFFGYVQGRRKRKERVAPTITGVTGKILKIVAPLSVTSYIRSFLHLAEDVLILAGLKTFSGRDDVATGTYGMLKGMVMPLLVFPLMLLSSFVITLTPEISRMNATGNTRRLEQTVETILHYTCVAGVLIVAVFMTFPYEIGMAVYKNAEVGEMLKALSFLCPFMCIEMVSVGILTGLGQQVSSMRYAVMDSVCRIGMIYFLIPQKGVTGFMVMVAVSNLLTSLLNFIRLLRITKIRLRLNEWALKPALAAAAASQMVKMILNYADFSALPGWMSLAAGIGVVGVAYVAVLFSIGSIRMQDFRWILERLKTTTKIPDAPSEA